MTIWFGGGVAPDFAAAAAHVATAALVAAAALFVSAAAQVAAAAGLERAAATALFAAAAITEVEVSLLTPATDLEALTGPDGVTDV